MKGLNPYEMDNPNAITDYVKIVREIVQQEIRKASFNRSIQAVVASTPAGGACDIKLLNEGNTITGVKIRTGLTISMGDEVYVTFINNQSSNFFIDFKK